MKTDLGPLGQGNYEVKHGDCMLSIATRFGFFWETLWNLPENADLKRTRKDPNILLPGDLLTIPDRRIKQETRSTDTRHKFKLRGEPAKFVMALFEDGEPLAGEPYMLSVDGDVRNGKLDGGGVLHESIRPDAKRAILRIGTDKPVELVLGSLDPVTEVSGIQGRLRNLGFNPGALDGIPGPTTEAAIRSFQKSQGMEETGEINQQLRSKLLQVHGS